MSTNAANADATPAASQRRHFSSVAPLLHPTTSHYRRWMSPLHQSIQSIENGAEHEPLQIRGIKSTRQRDPLAHPRTMLEIRVSYGSTLQSPKFMSGRPKSP